MQSVITSSNVRLKMPLCMVAALVAVTALSLEAGARIAIHVSPAIAFAPASVVVRTTVEKDADNRSMEVEIDGDGYFRSSLVPLEGESAPRTTTIELRDLPGGSYVVRATLVGRDGQAHDTVAKTIEILSR
jgi:hypothetical protein